jgi:hypothetical protein
MASRLRLTIEVRTELTFTGEPQNVTDQGTVQR